LADDAIAVHHHNIDQFGNDKRINLESNIIVPSSDWTTSDYTTFYTTQPILGASGYEVSFSGTVNSSFISNQFGNASSLITEIIEQGGCPFLFSVDNIAGSITFQYALFSNNITTANASSFPFSTNPGISVSLLNVSETENVL
jgi:hypothetical protein